MLRDAVSPSAKRPSAFASRFLRCAATNWRPIPCHLAVFAGAVFRAFGLLVRDLVVKGCAQVMYEDFSR